MTGIRFAATAFILATLTPVAFAQQPPKPAPQPAKPAAAQPAKPAATAAARAGDAQPTLLGQYGDWGAYTASPGGNKVASRSPSRRRPRPSRPAANATQPMSSSPPALPRT